MNINFQTAEGVLESKINTHVDFLIWSRNNLRSRGNKLYVLMMGELPITHFPIDILITPYVIDIETYIGEIALGNSVFIQEFESQGYADAIGYLHDLYELKEETNINPSKN